MPVAQKSKYGEFGLFSLAFSCGSRLNGLPQSIDDERKISKHLVRIFKCSNDLFQSCDIGCGIRDDDGIGRDFRTDTSARLQ